nr:MAG TPA: hypothetical protein [Caudoviricetes sp.]
MNIVQYHHSCEVSSSKIRQFFAEFHVSWFLRNYNVYKMCGFAVMTARSRPRRCSRGGSSTNGRRMRQSPPRLRGIRSTISMDSWIRPTSRRPIAPMTGEDRRNILIIENDNDSLLKRNCPRKWSCWPASTTMSVARS